ncbi:uncharacterized protein LAESUDRAFT_765633 [Laetiporus sulphureus 93-53]|uniref:snRNA-activating protein complex subunit 3 n=1 Tax=Laetiporus sulphureus 93-53 TaxID=1314785 RepID=A0A165ANQ9_9APHY|nr:uncharacterized protein LAESUDRAFT_765633 [Laetiporus sulphureus 93-53]KZS99360.1 hypothetical protein LAESUDRAFT_765633 [Laetiporus sulphureus 93-53]
MILNKLSGRRRQLFRSSQHVLLSSQILVELSDVIPCTSNELPRELPDTPTERTRYKLPTESAAAARETSPGCAICINGTVYGDRNSTDDYSDKLLPLLLRRIEEPGDGVSFRKGASIRETTFASLSLQLHKSYWMLHFGNCEHYFLIDQIRLLHASDPPPSAYPLTTHITPPLLDLCRACSKVPAVYAIDGDIFGETLFVKCGPC